MARVISDNIAFLLEAREAIDELSQLKEYQRDLDLEKKRLEKAISAEKKAVSDSISLTVKRRVEEINASYDKEINNDQERMKRIRVKREKAKSQGVRERIVEETFELRDYNRELYTQISTLFRQTGVSRLCNSTFYYAMYFTKGPSEMLVFLTTIIICFLAIPCGVYLLIPNAKLVYLVGIYFASIIVFGGIYLVVNNLTKVHHLDSLKKGRNIRNVIASNKRKIKVITKSVRRDKNEDIYNLEKYDDEIAQLEGELADIARKKKEALNVFETVTKNIISDEIVSNSQDRISQLDHDLYEAGEELKQLQSNLKERSIGITDNYEVYVGNEFLQPERLDALIEIFKNGLAENISEAISYYKNAKK